jgi:hypothetical protein
LKFTKPQLTLLEGLAKLHTDSGIVGAPPDGRVRLAAYNRRTVNALVDRRCVDYHVSPEEGEWFALTEFGFRIAQCWINRSSNSVFILRSGVVTLRTGGLLNCP